MASTPNSATIQVRIQPNASKNEISGCNEGVLRIRVAAPPVDGKANKELVSFLSRLLKTGKSNISILKGQTSRNKLVAIEGMDYDSAISVLSPGQKRLL